MPSTRRWKLAAATSGALAAAALGSGVAFADDPIQLSGAGGSAAEQTRYTGAEVSADATTKPAGRPALPALAHRSAVADKHAAKAAAGAAAASTADSPATAASAQSATAQSAASAPSAQSAQTADSPASAGTAASPTSAG
jgi:hypothetical protein